MLRAENPYKDVPMTLWYYKDEESARAGRNGSTIEVDHSCTVCKGVGDSDAHAHYFEVNTPTRKYALCATSAAELSEWVAVLNAPPVDDDNDVDKERSESTLSVALSFSSSGPLNEVHSGWMKKKGQGVFGAKMQKRYFVLYDNRELHYFEGASMESIQRKGRIRMSEAVALERTKPHDRKDFSFCIREKGRDWILDPGSQATWEQWEAKLRPMLVGSKR